MIEWKEREHEGHMWLALHDQGTLDVLRDCGILNSSEVKI
jgi:hypothetical protein